MGVIYLEQEEDSWEKKFIHGHYYLELYQKSQNLTQGSKSVENYLKKIEVAMIWVNVIKDREVIVVRLLNGLNHKIVNVIELQ
jgi:hypothetical protein